MRTKLGRSLSRSELPDSATRKREVVGMAADLRSTNRRPKRRRAGTTAIALVAAVGLAATPPGQAGVEAVGELVGIGDPPSDPPFISIVGPQSAGVLATGETAEGTQFEVVLATEQPTGQDTTGCVYVSYPDPDLYPSSASCLTKAVLRARQRPGSMGAFPSIQRTGPAPAVNLLVTATATSDIVEGKLVVEGQDSLEVDMTVVSFEAPNAGRQITEGEPSEPTRLSYLVGFLPSSVLGGPDLDSKPATPSHGLGPGTYPEVAEAIGRIRVQGFGSDGELIAEEPIDRSPWAAATLSESLYGKAKPDTAQEVATRQCLDELAEQGVVRPASDERARREELRAFGKRLDRCVEGQLGVDG